MDQHSGKILRTILKIEKEPLAKGHVLLLQLECGHIIPRMSGLHLKVGKRVGCPHCPLTSQK